jgi:hypothetical protein
MKLLNSVPASNGSNTFYVPKGQYGAFMIEYDLDAALGIDLTRANMGNVILKYNGEDVINIDAEMLNLINNVYGGTAKFSAVTGGATRMNIVIPCGLYFDSRNVYDVGENDQLSFKLDFPDLALTANVDSGNVRIYGKSKIGQMAYLHKMTSRFIVASGAGRLNDTYPINNVSQVYLKNPSALIDRVQITKDDETVVDADVDVLQEYSDYIHVLETAGTTLVLEMGESKDIREYLGVQVSYSYNFTGAGTLSQYFSYIEFTENKKAESSVRANNKVISAINRQRGFNS